MDTEQKNNETTPRMQIETKQLADLKPADYNPRTISDEALEGLTASVKRFGLVAGVAKEQIGRDVGLINARVAALKVRLAERRA